MTIQPKDKRDINKALKTHRHHTASQWEMHPWQNGKSAEPYTIMVIECVTWLTV
jgi:hypothetical protein